MGKSDSEDSKGIIDAPIDSFTLLILFVVVASAISVLLLAISYFHIPVIFAGTVIICSFVLTKFGVRVHLSWPKMSFMFTVLAALAVLVRSDIYPHLMGGQDQGFYVNMAEVLLREGGLNFTDVFRAALRPEEKTIYDLGTVATATPVDLNQSVFTVSFYPMHPIWMGISKWLFGEGLYTLSLFFFSFISIISGYYLTKELFNSHDAASIAAAFLSLNPGLVFFSKFPVGEIVGVAFSVTGFLFFLRSVNSTNIRSCWFYGILGVLSFNAFFYVRMQFLMYVPFFSLLLLSSLVVPWSDVRKRNVVRIFVSTTLLLFALSLCFYRVYQQQLFDAIILGHVRSLLNVRILLWLLPALLVLGGGIVFAYTHSFSKSAFLESAKGLGCRCLKFAPWLLVVAFIASVPSVFSLYRTGAMPPFWMALDTNDNWLIRYHVIYRLIIIISPVSFIVLLIAPLLRNNWRVEVLFCFLFVSTVWIAVLLQPWVPYLYYYGRYLVSEMVPYSLILVAGVLGSVYSGKKSKFILFSVIIITIYFVGYSFSQYGKIESELPGSYRDVLKHVSRHDVVLTHALSGADQVPFRLAYGLNIFPITDHRAAQLPLQFDTITRLEKAAKAEGGSLFLLTPSDYNSKGITFVSQLNIENRFISNGEHLLGGEIQVGNGARRFLLPSKQYHSASRKLRLYRLDVASYKALFVHRCSAEVDLALGGALYIDGLTGFSGPDVGGRWTDGTHASYTCKFPENISFLPNKIRLEMAAFAPGLYRQRAIISVNGKYHQTVTLEKSDHTQIVTIPLMQDIDEIISLGLELPDAKSPRDFKIGSDDRKLGVMIRKIWIE